MAQKTLVQDSFNTIVPIADDAASLFYRRLFELDPSLERMFPADMTEQRKKLMQMLAAAVKGLDRTGPARARREDLGRRHAGYGVSTRTTTRSVPRCSGRSKWDWAARSPPK